jgi:hypothetical protein
MRASRKTNVYRAESRIRTKRNKRNEVGFRVTVGPET